MGGSRIRRRSHLCAEWRLDRNDPAAGDVRQSLLRREASQPPVYGGESVSLFGLRGNSRRAHLLRQQAHRLVDDQRLTVPGANERSEMAVARLEGKQVIAEPLGQYPEFLRRFRELSTMHAKQFQLVLKHRGRIDHKRWRR